MLTTICLNSNLMVAFTILWLSLYNFVNVFFDIYIYIILIEVRLEASSFNYNLK